MYLKIAVLYIKLIPKKNNSKNVISKPSVIGLLDDVPIIKSIEKIIKNYLYLPICSSS